MLYVKSGRLVFDFNDLGRGHSVITSSQYLSPGKQTVRFEYVPISPTKGTGILSVNGVKVGEGPIAKSPTTRYLSWEGLDVGRDADE